MIRETAWQALPPRKKSRRGQQPAVASAAAPAANQGNSGSASVGKTQQIADNVAARSSAKTMDATLEGKDGCAGEFYEYLDHTADVQCHSWGPTLEAAFEAMAPCMFNYMTDLSLVEPDDAMTTEFSVSGHDMHTLLFAYMDELLFRFCTDQFCVTAVQVLELDRQAFSLRVRARGAAFDRSKHSQGTEIKAITYSNMQVHEAEAEGRADLYVIVDI